MRHLLIDRAHLTVPAIQDVSRDGGRVFDYDNFQKMLRDAKVGSGAELFVTINATHSGTIVNRRVYPGSKMRDAVESWVHPYPLPVLSDHPTHSLFGSSSAPDVYGRVQEAEFVRLTKDRDMLDADWKNPSIGDIGSGFIRLRTRLTDKDGIEGVLAKELLTVSTGQFTDRMTCSICGADHFKRGCDHIPGQYYDLEEEDGQDAKKKSRGQKRAFAFGITGRLKYDHVAFVNTPAQPYAAVVSIDEVGKVMDRQEADKGMVNFTVHDIAIQDEHGLVHFTLDHEDTGIVMPDRKRAAAVISSIDDPINVSSKEPRMKRPDASAGVVEASAKADDKLLQASLQDKEEEPTMSKLKPEALAEAFVLSSLKDGGLEFDWEAYKEKTGRDRSFIEVLGDADQDINGLPEKLRDAIKEVSEDAYCGPNKTLPVVDQLSADAARRLMAYVRTEDKAAIDSAIENRLNPVDDSCDTCDDDVADSDTAKLKKQVDQLTEQNDRLQEENKALRSRVRKGLVDSLVTARQTLRKPDVMGLSDKDMDAYRNKLLGRSIESLEDSLEDLRTEQSAASPDRPDTKVEDPTLPATDQEKASPEQDKKDEKETNVDSKEQGTPKSLTDALMSG